MVLNFVLTIVTFLEGKCVSWDWWSQKMVFYGSSWNSPCLGPKAQKTSRYEEMRDEWYLCYLSCIRGREEILSWHDLEFLALKWTICKRFRDYLFHTPHFVVYTDNNPLMYILTTVKLNTTGQLRMLAKYLLILLLKHWIRLHLNDDGILYRKARRRDQLILPKEYHQIVFKELH